MIYVCIIANGLLVCFLGAYFSGLSDVLEYSSNGSGMTGRVSIWQEIATQLARELGH